jgi:RimJ/RimL family protein N-acetyltransferase
MGLVEIRTARLLLRPVACGDADSVHQYRGDPAVAAYLTHPPLDLEETGQFVTRAAALWSTVDDERFNLLFAVVLHGEVIGDVHAWNVAESPQPASPDPADVWIGCALRPDQQGLGYATEAVRVLVDWLFARGARNVFANYYLDNAPSRRLLDRLGFEEHLRYTAEQDACGKHAPSCRMRLGPQTQAAGGQP